jgi:hypothetical protein
MSDEILPPVEATPSPVSTPAPAPVVPASPVPAPTATSEPPPAARLVAQGVKSETEIQLEGRLTAAERRALEAERKAAELERDVEELKKIPAPVAKKVKRKFLFPTMFDNDEAE